MCGIVELVDLKRRLGPDELRTIASRMADSLVHRGPDDRGGWIDAEAGVAIGHTRLAIIDLSPAGAQPMISSCGRFVLSYNGEIYNASEIHADLQAAGRPFRGHSDTEVMVEGFAVWGVRPTIERVIGMFAFAAWDRSTRKLTLGRDRLGIKPLYWGHVDGSLVFASELKALKTLPGWRGELDRDALSAFLRYGYVPTPMSIYRGVHKLAPGTLLECGKDGKVRCTAYWSLSEIAARGQASPLDVPDAAAQEMLESLLADAVRRRMVADVPLGMFLSGGIDSSTVAALMQADSARPIRTFSIGFRERAYDEAAHAKEVAAHLGTEHTELYVTPAEARAVIPKLHDIYDEPFADFIADPDLSRVGDDAAPRDRRPFRRRRRRGFRRLQPIWAGACAGENDPDPTEADAASHGGGNDGGHARRLGLRFAPRAGANPPAPRGGQDSQTGRRPAGGLDRVLSASDHAMARGIRSREGRFGTRRKPVRKSGPGPFSRRCLLDAISRYAHLSARRYPGQGGPRQHGGGARGPCPAPRSPRGRILVAFAAAFQVARRSWQMAVAADRLQICAEEALGTAENGVWGSHRSMVAWSAQGMGGRFVEFAGDERCRIA